MEDINKNCIKVIHLTDLHYGKDKLNWDSKWEHVCNHILSLVTKVDNLIITITGDLVDHPKDELFAKFAKKLSDFYKILVGVTKRAYIITVPGNHDRFYSGMANPLSTRKNYSLFNTHAHKFLMPNSANSECYNTLLEEICADICEQTRVAFYPFDSTGLTKQFLISKVNLKSSIAQGHIDEPLTVLERINKLYKDKKCAIKIALMHHHPMPMAASNTDIAIEPFMILKNAAQVMNVLYNNSIDIIFHGHHHKSALYNWKNLLLSNNSKNLCISACANSISFNGSKAEMRVLKIEDSYIQLDVFQSDPCTNNQFIKQNTEHFNIHNILGCSKNFDSLLNEHDPKEILESLDTKSKIVKIRDDGSSSVVLTWENLKAKDGTTSLDFQENIKIGPGRVEALFTAESKGDHLDGVNYNEKGAAEISQFSCCPTEYSTPSYSFKFEKPFPKSFAIQYEVANMFATNRLENEDIYGYFNSTKPKGTTDNPNQYEYVTVSSNCRTGQLELILQFADISTCPSSNEIELIAWNQSDQSCQQFSKHPIRPDWKMNRRVENEINRNQKNLRKMPHIGLFTLTINDPIPKLAYSLRWRIHNGITDAIINKLKSLRSDFEKFIKNTQNQTQVSKIAKAFSANADIYTYEEDASDFDNYYEKAKCNFSLHYFNKGDGLLKSINDKNEEGLSVIVGRGVVGRSYRRGSPIFWSEKFLYDKFGPENTGLIPEKGILINGKTPAFLAAFPIIHDANEEHIINENESLKQSKIVGFCSFYLENVPSDHIFVTQPESEFIKELMTWAFLEIHQWYNKSQLEYR